MTKLTTVGMTVAELNALPDAFAFEHISVVLQPDDIERGTIEVEEHTLPVGHLHVGDTLHVPKPAKGFVMLHGPHEAAFWRDELGLGWTATVVENADGERILAKRHIGV